jgi:hypothetical protein
MLTTLAVTSNFFKDFLKLFLEAGFFEAGFFEAEFIINNYLFLK